MKKTGAGQVVSAGLIFDQVDTVTDLVSRFVLGALVVLVIGEALLRSFVNLSLGFAEEVTGYLVVALTLFGAARALRSGSLFEVCFISDRLRGRSRRLLQSFYVLLSLSVCIVLAIKSADLVASSLARGKFAATVLHTPLWIPQLLLPVGFAVIGFFLLEKLLLLFQQPRTEAH